MAPNARRVAPWIAGLLLVAAGWFAPAVAEAATLVVTSTADQRAKNKPPPPGSLRDALFRANPGDTITFQVGVPIVLLARLQVDPDLTGITPGELWIRNPVGTAVGTKIGAVGTEPRRIRCLPSANRCVVSNFGSDSLTIVQWDGLGAASILGTAPVGDGPVGIDLRAGGTGVAVISTGFDDDTYTVTKLAADGSVTSNVTAPAPAGCTDPGHGLRLDGAPGTIVLTCSGSDAYAVIAP